MHFIHEISVNSYLYFISCTWIEVIQSLSSTILSLGIFTHKYCLLPYTLGYKIELEDDKPNRLHGILVIPTIVCLLRCLITRF